MSWQVIIKKANKIKVFDSALNAPNQIISFANMRKYIKTSF